MTPKLQLFAQGWIIYSLFFFCAEKFCVSRFIVFEVGKDGDTPLKTEPAPGFLFSYLPTALSFLWFDSEKGP